MVWEEMLYEEFQDGYHATFLDIGMEDFSNSEPLCHSDAFHQVLVPSSWFGRRCPLKYFKMAHGPCGGHLGHCTCTILAVLNLYVAPSSLSSIQFTVWEERSFEDFMAAILDAKME